MSQAQPAADDLARMVVPADPAISVVMAVYNVGAFLEPAIQSVLRQSFTDFEFIIIDDGSTDGSGDALDAHAARDPRIRVLHQENQGCATALNAGLDLSRAPLIARMDADDISLPDRLRLQYDELRRRPDLSVLGAYVELIDEAGVAIGTSVVPIGEREVARVADSFSPVTHPSVMMRRDAVDAVGRYRSAVDYSEDYDLWLRLLDGGYTIDNLPRILLRYRMHGASVSNKGRASQGIRMLMAQAASRMRRDGLPDPLTGRNSIDVSTLDELPEPYRPCASVVWEAMHGAVHEAPAQAVEDALATLAPTAAPGVAGPPDRCRCTDARFLLRAAARLLTQRRPGSAGRALRQALSADPFVVARQARFTLGMRVPRAVRKLRFLAAEATGRRAER